MASFNSCTFTGRVGADPDCRYYENGSAVASFRIAVDQYAKKGADKPEPIWIKVNVWGKRAQTIADHVKKGSSILVSGELGIDTYEKDGEKRTSVTLNCSQFNFLGDRRSDGASNQQRAAQRPAQAPAPDDDDIPF